MSLSLVLTLVAALAVLAATAVLVSLMRRLRTNDPLGGDIASSSAPGGSELRDLTERIEAAVTQQQEQGETQRQRLSQQIDGVQQSVGEQRVLVDNLRSEVRHESQRRDNELEEIRHQIASIHHALPTLGAGPDADTLALPAADEAAEAPADPFVAETQDLVYTASSTDAESDWEDVTWEAAAAPATGQPTEATDELAPATVEPSPVENDDIFTFEDAFASFTDVTPVSDHAHAPEAAAEEMPLEPSTEPSDAVETFVTEDAAVPAETDRLAPATLLDEPDAIAEPVADERTTPDLASSPDAATLVAWSVEPDAAAEADAPDDVVFEELTLAEMSFEEFSFEDFAVEDIDAEDAGAPGDVEMGAFDADPFTTEEAADPFVVVDEAPEISPALQPTSPDVSAAPSFPETTPASPQAEPEPSTQSDAPGPSFAPTPFLDDTLPVADPLAFEEAFVPAPIVDAAPAATEEADSLFATWSPAKAPEADPGPLTFAEASAPPASDEHAASAEAIPEDASSTDLSTFEDWGLDPIPMAAPTSDATWTAPETTPNAFEAWAPSQSPESIPTPAPAPQPPSTTAWVARNESIQPMPPPAPHPASPAASPTPYAEVTPAADPVGLASSFEPQPAQAESPMPAATYATFPVEPSSPVVSASAPAVAAASVPAPAPSPAVIAPAQPDAAPAPSSSDSERLTVLPSIDEDIERALHLAGVTSLDEMARWGRTEARRIAAEVGVSEDTVLNHWVFEAQTALFERFTQQAGV